jgi:hypothetical protein
VIPVITEATGTISKPFRKYLSNMTGKLKINQGTGDNIHIGDCTHTSGSTDVKVQNSQHGK